MDDDAAAGAGSLSFSEASPATKGTIYLLGTIIVAVVVVAVTTVIKGIVNVLSTFFVTSETDALAARAAGGGGKGKKQQKQHGKGGKRSEHAVHEEPTALQQEPEGLGGQQHPPGVSLKALMKKAKSNPKTAAHAADKGSQHHLFIATLKGHTDAVTGVAFSRDSSCLATACEDRVVRLFRTSDIPSRSFQTRRRALTTGLVDVAFGAEPTQLAVLTKGTLNAASLVMLSGPSLEQQDWEVKNVLTKQPGMLLRSSSEGPVVLMTCSPTATMAVVGGTGKVLSLIDTNGLKNHSAALSPEGNLVAAATFTADVKVHEVKMDRAGNYMGCSKVMDLKAHTSQVTAVDFSPCGRRMVTASKDGTWRVWKIDVRYSLQEDPKCILTAKLPLPTGGVFSLISYGPKGLVAAAHNGAVHLLDAATGQVVEVMDDAHEAAAGVAAMAWSPGPLDLGGGEKAHVLATASTDRRVRLWRCPVQ